MKTDLLTRTGTRGDAHYVNLTEAQLVALRFTLHICDSLDFGDEVHGVHPRRGQAQMFERLRLMGLLAEAGIGYSDSYAREVQVHLYEITEAGRAAAIHAARAGRGK